MSIFLSVIGLILVIMAAFTPWIYFLYRTLYGNVVLQCPINSDKHSFTIHKTAYYGVFIEGDLFGKNPSKQFPFTITDTLNQNIKTRPALIFIRRSNFSRILILERYVKLTAGTYTFTITHTQQSPTLNKRLPNYQIREVVPDFYFGIWLVIIYIVSQLIFYIIK